MTPDAQLVAELVLLVRARVPARAVRLTIRERLIRQMGETPVGAPGVADAVERALRAAGQVQQETAGSTELVETVYIASLEAVRGHGGETARWMAEAKRRAHAVLNEMAARGVEPTWARRVLQVEGWERW
jgi:hypothetical protein